MGTNFYMRYKTCDNREHDNMVHIGKRSGGWPFTFAADTAGNIFDMIDFMNEAIADGAEIWGNASDCPTTVAEFYTMVVKWDDQARHVPNADARHFQRDGFWFASGEFC